VTQEVEQDEVPPWERPGAVRRDCEPDRNWLLGPLGGFSLACGALSFLPCCFPVAVVGVPLGLTTWLLARRDLARMRAGEMDRRGAKKTGQAVWEGRFGLFSCLALGLYWGLAGILAPDVWVLLLLVRSLFP
jgi:hypothetical protein